MLLLNGLPPLADNLTQVITDLRILLCDSTLDLIGSMPEGRPFSSQILDLIMMASVSTNNKSCLKSLTETRKVATVLICTPCAADAQYG